MILTELVEHYSRVRAHTVALCNALEIEDHVAQPAIFVSPPKWHLGHRTWFSEAFVLEPFVAEYRAHHPSYGFVFNSYYHSAGDRTPRVARGSLTRPTVSEVRAYRDVVDRAMREFLLGELTDDMATRVVLGLEHEQQHQELLIYDIKYILGLNPLFPSIDLPVRQPQVGIPGWLQIDGGMYQIGAREGFFFDNEAPQHAVYLPNSEISQSLVSNGEYLAFIHAGGYRQPLLWLDEGWTWVQQQGVEAPLYWHVNDRCVYDLEKGLTELDESAPVQHLSYYEADAYARFVGMRLPTEFEREVAAADLQNGQLWEWSQSAYGSYPGFRASTGAIGEYNGKFMVNQMVLRGGSVATPADQIRPTYRNFFHPDERWMYSGLRLAR